MIKRIFLAFSVFFITSNLLADDHLDSIYFAPTLSYAVLDQDGDIDSTAMMGISLGYEIKPRWALEIGHERANTETRYGDDADLSAWYLGGSYQGWEHGSWKPFITGALSTWSFDIDSLASQSERETKIAAGVGSFFEVSPQLKLRIQAVGSYNADNELLDTIISVGFQLYPTRSSSSSSRSAVKAEDGTYEQPDSTQ